MDAHLELVLSAPELAVLSALEATLSASVAALTAAYAETGGRGLRGLS